MHAQSRPSPWQRVHGLCSCAVLFPPALLCGRVWYTLAGLLPSSKLRQAHRRADRRAASSVRSTSTRTPTPVPRCTATLAPARAFPSFHAARSSRGLQRPVDGTSSRDHHHTRRRGLRLLCLLCEYTMGRALAAAQLRAPHSHCRRFVERNSDCCPLSDIPSDALCAGTGEHSAALDQRRVAPARTLCSHAAMLLCCVLLHLAFLRRWCVEPMQRARPTAQESVQTPAWQ